MRGLGEGFVEDLVGPGGRLAPVLTRVLDDHSLCLEIRDDYVNLYYRGGNLLRLAAVRRQAGLAGYCPAFDRNYLRADIDGAFLAPLPKTIVNATDARAWVDAFPMLKLAMDVYLGQHAKEEREAQQLIVRDNNRGRASQHTDYYVCDIEYETATTPGGRKRRRFDMVAVHWPSDSGERKNATGRRLVLVEVKYGDGAIDGAAGLHSHIEDVNQFLADEGNLAGLKEEMVGVFNQKRALGLVNCGRDLGDFGDQRPMLLLVLANHDPGSTILRRAMSKLPASPHAEVCLAGGSLMGYGLYDQAIVTLDDRERLGARL